MTTRTALQGEVVDALERTDPADRTKQYGLWKVLGIWALGALPMPLLAWVVAPAIIPYSPFAPGITFWLLMIAGMAWQFVLSLVIVYRELGTLRWSAIRERTWLQAPRDPGTDRPNGKLFWWLVPALLFSAFVNLGIGNYLEAAMGWLFPGLHPAAFMDMQQMASPGFRGQWWILGIALLSALFNYFLGEEFLFRGVLLPKMRGAFGKADWVANGVLFGMYHLHKPWSIPANILSAFALTLPSRRFRSNWFAIVVHGVEVIPLLMGVLAVILGISG
jgi:CAAX protease family protein